MATIPLITSIFLFQSLYSAVQVSVFSLIMALVFLAIPVLVVINIIRKKVIVEDDQITYAGLFSKKKLLFHSIKGYRIGFKNIYLEPLLPGDPTIVIGHYRDLEYGVELMQWIKETFQELNGEDLSSQRTMLATSERWGATEEARKKTLVRAHTFALIYNILSFPLVLTLVLNASKTVLVLILAYPLVGILLMLSGRGLIKFQSDRQRCIYAFVLFGISVPGLALLIKSAANDNVLDNTHLWAPALGLSLLLFVLIYVTGLNRSTGRLRVQLITMILTALLYGFGSALQVNWIFDPARPVIYNATILNSRVETRSNNRISGDRDKAYYLIISPWGPGHEAKEVSVPGSLFLQSQKGDTVQVQVGQGLLHIPWFAVTNVGPKIGEKRE
jgi:hypothetical protein